MDILRTGNSGRRPVTWREAVKIFRGFEKSNDAPVVTVADPENVFTASSPTPTGALSPSTLKLPTLFGEVGGHALFGRNMVDRGYPAVDGSQPGGPGEGRNDKRES